MKVVDVYTPRTGSSLCQHIAPGSAIVMEEIEGGVMLWYEGDVHGIGMSFEEKAKHAAGRMFQHYPTVAKLFVPSKELPVSGLEQVGMINERYAFHDQRGPVRIGIAKVDHELSSKVAKHGFAVVAVGGGEDSPPFAYTIGLALCGHPELCMVGFQPDLMYQLLNTAGKRVLEGEELPNKGRIDGVIQEGQLLAMDPLNPWAGLQHFTRAMVYFQDRRPFKMRQLFIPDNEMRLPGDEGYDPKLAAIQDGLLNILSAREKLAPEKPTSSARP